MRDLETDNSWTWSRDKFLNRKYIMQEHYNNFVDGEKWEVPKEKDPFWEPLDQEELVGVAHVFLQSLSYLIEVEETLPITDFKGNEKGEWRWGGGGGGTGHHIVQESDSPPSLPPRSPNLNRRPRQGGHSPVRAQRQARVGRRRQFC